MLAFRWRWSVAKNSAGFSLERYKIPLALALHYKISAGAGANADQRTRPILCVRIDLYIAIITYILLLHDKL